MLILLQFFMLKNWLPIFGRIFILNRRKPLAFITTFFGQYILAYFNEHAYHGDSRFYGDNFVIVRKRTSLVLFSF